MQRFRIRKAGKIFCKRTCKNSGFESSRDPIWLDTVTYQDIRNRKEYTISRTKNLIYNDKMKNVPSLMANGEIRLQNPLSF